MSITTVRRFGDIMGTLTRAKHDWYQDQPEATEALLGVERFSGLSWDPCCGIGTIPNTMVRLGSPCLGSDLVNRGFEGAAWPFCEIDFLASDAVAALPGPDEEIANIVSNPPFKDPIPFVERALSIAAHKVAFLLPLTFLEGAKRSRWRITTPLARIRTFSWRISMPPGEMLQAGEVEPVGGKKAFAWFVWEHGWQGPPQEIPLLKGTA